ncbi:adenylate/guanylate cyclase domain-containing protein [Pseudoxanthobacter sp. M-2]|uniref:adenylate/guanylate cyclase domain-containing protein n=1 Tax=Pseudoxanthobacter sp. M-2 TaxID=3078754 RepID=UPI0038FCCC75
MKVDAPSIMAWLVGEGRSLAFSALIDGFGWRLTAAGLPVDRFSVSVRVLSASVLAVGAVWRPHMPLEFRTFDYADRDAGFYDRSPFKVVYDTGRPLHLDLRTTPDDRFGIVPELKKEGYVHYHVLALDFADGVKNAVTMSSKAPEGFTSDQIALVEAVLPALAAVIEIRTYHRVLRELLATYVGRGPAEAIIGGTVFRGDVKTMRAAMMFADLRNFTSLSTRLPPEATADLLNRYYDVLVPAVTERGGDVLKFIGDGMLAVFEHTDEGADAAARALSAAEVALLNGAELTAGGEPVRFGVALHHGEAIYGNVGALDRLDFTVVGRDVNEVARISSLCGQLGKPMLASRAFAGMMPERFRPAGAHPVRGIVEPLPVFEPAPALLALSQPVAEALG